MLCLVGEKVMVKRMNVLGALLPVYIPATIYSQIPGHSNVSRHYHTHASSVAVSAILHTFLTSKLVLKHARRTMNALIPLFLALTVLGQSSSM